MRSKAKYLTEAALIAALYAAVTVFSMQFLSEFRPAEALTLLPVLTPSAVPGLFVGCLIANLFTGNVWDILFGPLITLAAAILTRLLSKVLKDVRFCPVWALPPVLLNAFGVSLILYYGYGLYIGGGNSLPVIASYALTILVSEAISVFALGIPLTLIFRKKEVFK